MKKVQVFDPALCCSSGVCGPDVNQDLVSFSADVDWAKQNGALLERFNLAQQPMAFVDNAVVKALLQQNGEAALPVTLIDGVVVLSGKYPTRQALAGWLNIKEAVSLFSPEVAELVAIGASIASNCETCFKYHFEVARKLGVSDADMLQAVNLAQKVKEAPAQTVLELAYRLLQPNPTAASNPVGADAGVKTNASCCGGSSTGKSSSKCCG